jgi:hypothetical protein
LHDWNNSRTKFRSEATTVISPWKSKLKLLVVEMEAGKRRMGLTQLGIGSKAGTYSALVTMNERMMLAVPFVSSRTLQCDGPEHCELS